MNEFNPIKNVEDSQLILENGKWPSFHDARVQNLNIWRSDARPDESGWIGPVIEASFELSQLKNNHTAVLKFHDCDSIRMDELNHLGVPHDLTFKLEARGTDLDGEPLTPHIAVSFEEASGVALTFKCLRVQAVDRSGVSGQV